jgi:radical S-adenosyl methionine domain-containing protein 2
MKTTTNTYTDGKQLVINWHITEVCNYSCEYCYAKWHKEDRPREFLHNEIQVKKLLVALYEFFKPSNANNPLHGKMKWSSVRLNLAGGEPTLYKDKMLMIMETARYIGFDVSIITNGSAFHDFEFVKSMAQHVSLLGVSLDSFEGSSNKIIGRINKKGELLNGSKIIEAIKVAKIVNPNMRFKINTVVNHANFHENMSEVINQLKPERWKVLRMLPVVTNSLTVTDDEFDGFVDRHQNLSNVMRIEDNQDMTESYIMIDPFGRFFQNSSNLKPGEEYTYSSPILDSGVDVAFREMSFSADKFSARYS